MLAEYNYVDAVFNPDPRLEHQLADARAICHKVLHDEGYDALFQRLPAAPRDDLGWFELLGGYPENAASVAAIRQMKAHLASEPLPAKMSVERGAVLHALCEGATQVGARPVPNSVKRLYASTCTEIATRTRQWEKFYDESSVHFMEIAKLATLTRYPAGDQVFAIYGRIPLGTVFKVPPRAVPNFLREVLWEFGGVGPLLTPHMNNGRANQLFLKQHEISRSIWRMAKTLEMNPHIRGICGASWFFSTDVATFFPHLAWLRAMFVDDGAYLVDMEPARDDSGLKMGSAKRRDLYAQGEFSPRRVMLLWPRNDLLAWAAQHPEYADEDDAPVKAPGGGAPVQRKPPSLPRPAPATKHNARITLWDAIPLINDNPKKYVGIALLAPALLAAAIAALAVAWWAAAPGFVVGLALAWLFQYYFFQ
jgi:hypothetical protein